MGNQQFVCPASMLAQPPLLQTAETARGFVQIASFAGRDSETSSSQIPASAAQRNRPLGLARSDSTHRSSLALDRVLMIFAGLSRGTGFPILPGLSAGG
jgi:hypothetical protein